MTASIKTIPLLPFRADSAFAPGTARGNSSSGTVPAASLSESSASWELLLEVAPRRPESQLKHFRNLLELLLRSNLHGDHR